MRGLLGDGRLRTSRLLLACSIFLWLNGNAYPQLDISAPNQNSEFSAARIAKAAYDDPLAVGQFAIPIEQLRFAELNDLPIGVFDSGIGGLTVLETILGLDAYHNDSASPGADGRPDFEGESFIYFGDQANMPYGNYGARGDINFLRELILRDALFLLGTKSWETTTPPAPVFTKTPVKAIVIACNTATAYGLEDIRQAIASWNVKIPVIGVVEAGANALVQQLPSEGPPEAIAVLATVGTCKSNAYPKAIASAAGIAGRRVPILIQQGSVGLAGAIEGNSSFIKPDIQPDDNSELESNVYQGPSSSNPAAPIRQELLAAYCFDENGLCSDTQFDSQVDTLPTDALSRSVHLNSVENYVRYEVTELVHHYSASSETTPITKVVLGCTHFPFESERIRQAFQRLRKYRADDGGYPYEKLVSEEIELIDPADLTARELYKTLFARRLRASPTVLPDKPTVRKFYFSIANPENLIGNDPSGGLTDDYKYGRRAGGTAMEDTIAVPLNIDDMPQALSKLLRDQCQLVWDQLQLQSE